MACIVKKPNGSFLIRVSNGMKNGKQQLVSVTFKPEGNISPAMAKRAAKKYAVLFEELVHSGGYEKKQEQSAEIRTRRRMTLEDFVTKYYYPSIKKHLSPNTCRTYELIIDQLLLPSFGRVELEDIDSTHLQNFVDFLSTPNARASGGEGLSPATVKRYATVFSSVMTEAWKQKILEEKPFKKSYIHYPKVVQPKLEAYNDDEVSAFADALSDEEVRTQALLMLALTTGMRRGELVGLMWSDIDFDTQKIRISRSVRKTTRSTSLIDIMLARTGGFANCAKISIWQKRKPATRISGLNEMFPSLNAKSMKTLIHKKKCHRSHLR